jgi:BirA family biotin operon repressor/biotin-[acetyl-CoA-carboxylase] ligase
MNQDHLETALADLPLGSVRYYEQIGSTNDAALSWAEAGCPNLSLVVADEQTAGRGRGDRRWHSPPGSALAFSLILKEIAQGSGLTHLTGLGGLSVSHALENLYALPTQVKWPNDVLAAGEKLAGVLAEAHWAGDRLKWVVIGTGINVSPNSIPPVERLDFPATCVESAMGRKVERWELLSAVLAEMLEWRLQLGTPEFVRAWEARLAYLGNWVQAIPGSGLPLKGQLVGLTLDGGLQIRHHTGDERVLRLGEIHLRPLTDYKNTLN